MQAPQFDPTQSYAPAQFDPSQPYDADLSFSASTAKPPAAAPKPGFWQDPKAFLENRSQELAQESQHQNDLALGPESQGKSVAFRLAHRMLSLVPETGALVDKLVAGGMDWKNALVTAAGAFDPAIPAAYFGTQGAAQLTGLAPGVNAGDTSPENVQNALLSAAMVTGAAGAADAPGAGRATRVVKPAVRLAARATEAAVNQKLLPVRKLANLSVPADVAEKIDIKIPGRDYGLERPVEPIGEPTAPTERDATLDSRNIPEHAGEEYVEPEAEVEPGPEPEPAKSGTQIYRDATLNKRNIPEFAGEEYVEPESPAAPVAAAPTAALPEANAEFWAKTKSVGGNQGNEFARVKSELFPGKRDLNNAEIDLVNNRMNQTPAPAPATGTLDQARAQLGPDAPLSKVVELAQELRGEKPEVSAGKGARVASSENIPRTLSGESALRRILTGQDNSNLLKIARSRGLDVTKEGALRPGFADNLLINKIINDMSPEELQNFRDSFLENSRNRHQFGDIGPEAWKTMSLQTYFPDVKLPLAQQLRTRQAIERQPTTADAPPAPATEDNLLDLLKKSVKQAKKKQSK